MKKILSITLVLIMLFSLSACGMVPTSTSHLPDNKNENKETNENNHESETNIGNNNGSMNNTNDGNEKTLCSTHNYVNNVCAVCKCSCWSGETDTSWYSVVETELTIHTADEFAGLIEIVNNGSDLAGVKITLANHIDMNSQPLTPIGATEENKFSGEFDGNGYSISNIILNSLSIIAEEGLSFATHTLYRTHLGLFGYTVGKISNLHVKNLTVDSNSSLYIGGIAAYNEGKIENCSVKGAFNISDNSMVYIGGIVGRTGGNNISNCSSEISITTHFVFENSNANSIYIGGIAGNAFKTSFNACYANGSISLFSSSQLPYDYYHSYVGGLIGEARGNSVKNCYSTIDISIEGDEMETCRRAYAGGLIGEYTVGTFENCYSTGDITVKGFLAGYVGGLIGGSDSCKINNCWTYENIDLQSENGEVFSIADGDVNICYYSSEQIIKGPTITKNGSPAPLNDLKNPAFYKNRLQWDETVWNIVDGEFPTLKQP